MSGCELYADFLCNMICYYAKLHAGVEWDKDSRGKHDGSCVDSQQVTHRHFTCPPGAGSFVKPAKILSGRTFTEALLERYVGLDAPMLTGAENVLPDSFVVTAKGEHKAIEFVGERVIRKHQQLADVAEVSVRNSAVSSGGSGLAELAGHVVSVDLQDNLFSSWDDIMDITQHLPRLASLFLHGNRIGDVDAASVSSYREHLLSVQLIALNLCGIKSWTTVKSLHEMLPLVSELYLAANKLEDISSLSSSYFPHVTIIDLSSCGIPSWRDIMDACGDLKSLEALVLDCNPFEEIRENEEGKFQNLSRLSLATTRFDIISCCFIRSDSSCLVA
jgi:hypothetical protein